MIIGRATAPPLAEACLSRFQYPILTFHSVVARQACHLLISKLGLCERIEIETSGRTAGGHSGPEQSMSDNPVRRIYDYNLWVIWAMGTSMPSGVIMGQCNW